MDWDGLGAAERKLVESATEGSLLVCSELAVSELSPVRDDQLVIRAGVLRDILLLRYADNLDPRGVRLRGAHIVGVLDLNDVPCPTGLELAYCLLDEPLTAVAAKFPWLDLSGTRVPALFADAVQVDGATFLHRGFTATGGTDRGALRLVGAHIGGFLDCADSFLHNGAGVAISATGLHVKGDLIFHRARAVGFSGQGAVVLSGARIGGSLFCEQACFRNESGPALDAAGLQVDGAIFVSDGFEAAGRGKKASLRISNARMAGLDLRDARMRNPDGLVLDLHATVTGWFWLPAETLCRSTRSDRAACDTRDQIRLDGFTYASLLPRVATVEQWLHWLRWHVSDYSAQPYQQLAAAHRAIGHEATARRVLIAQQVDLGVRGELGNFAARARHRVLGAALGYGYQTWRALIGLGIVLTLAIGLGLLAGHVPGSPGRFVAVRIDKTGQTNAPCSIIEQVGLGVDRSLPLINTGVRDRCGLDSVSFTGQLITVVAWILQLAGWALTTLVVAGYTGLVRKT